MAAAADPAVASLRRQRILIEWGLTSACACALAALAAFSGVFWRADLALYDSLLARNARAADPTVLIVAIDDASLAELGRWPWARGVHGVLLDRLTAAGARAVGMDLVFTEPTRDDEALAAAMRRNGRVVLPVVQAERAGAIVGETPPQPALAAAAARLAHIQVELDPDGMARSVYLAEGWQRAHLPQFALALLQVGEARHPAAIGATAAGSWQRAHWLRIPFVGPPGSFEQVSYADVLAGRVPAERIAGRYVLVGATALGMTDSVPVPTSGHSRPMAGIEVHANVLTALRHDDAIDLVGAWPQALAAIAATLLLMGALGRSSARAGLLWTLVLGLAAVLAAAALLRFGRIWLGPMPVLLGCIVAYPLWSWRRLEATQRFLDAELAELGREVALPEAGGPDPLQHRLAIVRRATLASRTAQQTREDTMRFVSHDLRSPLAAIINLIELQPEEVELLPAVRAQAQNALNLADEFFRLARAEASDPTRYEPLELGAVLDDAADEVWALAKKAGCELRRSREGDEAWVRGSPELLRRAVVNLLSNAIKYGASGGLIELSLQRGGEHWVVSVADHGPGIPPTDRERLFRRFGRLPDAIERGIPGVGLGLAMVHTVAERHGGSVGVDCPAAGGSVFSLRLPAVRPPA